jgi:signal transduction histidine kinase/ligand-binding sensor domain-containing protein
MRRAAGVLVRIVSLTALVVAGAVRADALDPGRTLTQYVHRIWQVPQGLPQASIYAIAQTADGRLWLGTRKGLFNFDGVRFTTGALRSGVSLADVWVTALHEDRAHALWIGTDESGLFRFERGVLTRFTRRDGLPSDGVRCLFEDRRGRLWVCTPDGIAIWDGSSFQPFAPGGDLALRNVVAACQTADDRVWIAHDDRRVDVWPPRADGSDPVTAAIGTGDAVRTMLCGGSGDVWIGTSDGLLEVAADRVRRITTANGLADNFVLTLAETRDGALVAGTNNGFSRVRGADVESFRPRDGLSQSAVFALEEDREGTLWVGTGHGLNQFLDGRATPYTTSEGLPSNDTGPVLRDRAGTTWVGTIGAGLARFDDHRFSGVTTRDGLDSDTVLALAEDRAGDLWVGTDRGLNRIHDGRVDRAWTAARGRLNDRVRALGTDASGALWIGTTHGIAVYRSGAIERRPGPAIAAIARGADGAMYVAPEDGALEVYVNGARNPVDAGDRLRHVDAIYPDADGVVWLGTRGDGLYAIDRGRIAHYTVRDGLFDDSIYAVLGDDRGRLWMACSKGIFSVDRGQLLRLGAGAASKVVSTPYSPTDVLRTIECKPGIQPAAFATADGLLWFSTTRGLLVLDSRNAERRFEPPPAVIEETTVNGEQSDPGGPAELGPERNNLSFRYTGLSFVVPARITFRYRLEGFDADWVDAATRREAFYTNLPPGTFRFLVSACNLDGGCGPAASTAPFRVEPRYYQRAWFIPLCLVCAALAGFTGYRLRIRRLRDQFALILAERSRIARELHDTLIQGFSGITMAMQALAARLPPSGERRALEQIVADAGTSLREARQSLFGLRSRPETGRGLADALAAMSRQLTEARGIRLRLQLDGWNGTLPPEIEYNLLRIAQEAVSNAVTHSGTRSVLIALDRTAAEVRLRVEDEGSGFDSARAAQAGHYGVLGMRERAAHIGATLDLRSVPGSGTAVSITLGG